LVANPLQQLKRTVKRFPLALEITAVLLVKLIAIFVIKFSFFSDPVDIRAEESSLEKQFGFQTRAPDSKSLQENPDG